MRTEAPDSPDHAAPRRWGLALFALALLPSLLAIWAVPGFVTQDGPSHLYNAHILLESLRPGAPLRETFEVRWTPVPNWAGHLTLMGLLTALPPRAADRAMTTLMLVGLAGSVAWLRLRVAGWRGMPSAALWAALLGMNFAWLMGFSSFLIGAALLPLTLGVWWGGRERFGPGRAAAVAALLAVGYFCHLVSLGLTALGLAVLAVATPGPGRRARLGWTAASLVVLAPLGLLYRSILPADREGLKPHWEYLKNPFSVGAWGAQLGSVDPITLGSKRIAPFTDVTSSWCGLLVPFVWFSLALAVLVWVTVKHPDPSRRGWIALAALLLLGGLAGPDSLGHGHGEFLPQRVFLLGLMALTPALDFGATGWGRWVAAGALGVAVALQSAFVWDYALRADRRVATLLRAAPAVGRGQRVGTLLLELRGRYRANPLLHADGLLGIGTDNVIWSNYEATHYYFPVHFRSDRPHPPENEFEQVSIKDKPGDVLLRGALWARLLDEHHDEVDRLLIWGRDPLLDAITARWFDPTPLYEGGPVRVLRRARRSEAR